MKIAIQGELGSFSHEAAIKMLPNCEVIPCQGSAEVFASVEKGQVNGAIIPIENTLAGSVAEHYDLLLSCDVFIKAEFHLRIIHNLIANQRAKLKNIRRIFSHPIALDQCRNFFRRHPKIQAVPFYDTAGSVRHVIEENILDAAAIASELAAKEYHGEILQHGMEDNKQNYTRFLLIQNDDHIRRAANKISLVFAIKNIPGALHHVLGIFATRGIDLSKIESRPVRGKPWEYVFYVDLLSGKNKEMRSVLQQLKKSAQFVKILGVYPAAK